MKFFDIRRFSGGENGDVVSYLSGEMGRGLRDLFVGLRKLNFLDNFDGFEWEGPIAPSTTVTIENRIGVIPTHRVILRLRPLSGGTIAIDDSQTEWTTSAVYLRNQGTASVSVKAFFIR